MESYTDIISLLNYNIKYSIEFERLVTKREIDSITIEKYNQEYGKSLEYPPNCSRLTQQDLIIRELEEKRRNWAGN